MTTRKPFTPADPSKFYLPTRVFLYTIDQIAVMLDQPVGTVTNQYIFYVGRSTGRWTKDLMQARNIAPSGEKPSWRVPERELLKWFKYKGFRVYEANVVLG